MDHRSAHPDLHQFPLGLAGMIALVILVESCLARHSLDFIGDAAFAWRWAAKTARKEATTSEVLCFGDSLVKFGVAPQVVQSRSGRTMWNLAVTGGRPANSYFLLRRALDAGARPSALIIDSETLSWDPFEIPYLWPQLAGPGEILEMAWLGKKPNFFAHYGLARLLPSVRDRYEIRSSILAAFRKEATVFRAAANLHDRNWRANRGAFIMPSTHQLLASSVEIIDSWPEERPRPGKWSPDPVNSIYLDKFLDLAADRGIPVFWLFPPHYRMLERYLEQPNLTVQHRNFARERLARYPNLVVVDGTRSSYDRTTVMDVSHLNRKGAVAYSNALGDILRNRLAAHSTTAPRWIELPNYQESPPETLLEDLAQSVQISIRRR